MVFDRGCWPVSDVGKRGWQAGKGGFTAGKVETPRAFTLCRKLIPSVTHVSARNRRFSAVAGCGSPTTPAGFRSSAIQPQAFCPMGEMAAVSAVIVTVPAAPRCSIALPADCTGRICRSRSMGQRSFSGAGRLSLLRGAVPTGRRRPGCPVAAVGRMAMLVIGSMAANSGVRNSFPSMRQVIQPSSRCGSRGSFATARAGVRPGQSACPSGAPPGKGAVCG